MARAQADKARTTPLEQLGTLAELESAYESAAKAAALSAEAR